MDWKLKWLFDEPSIMVGNVRLSCFRHFTRRTSEERWYAGVSIRRDNSSFPLKFGPMRISKAKAREDAVRLAGELLEDYHTSIVAEMEHLKKFKSNKN